MGKRTHEQIRDGILKALADGKEYSYGFLERKVNTNWETVRNHCKELEFYGFLTVSDKGIKITESGRKILQRLRKI